MTALYDCDTSFRVVSQFSKCLFYIHFYVFPAYCDTCDTSTNLVQKQFFIFNSSVFQLNFFLAFGVTAVTVFGFV